MRARDLVMLLLGAVCVAAPIVTQRWIDYFKPERVALQVSNRSKHDLVITAGDRKNEWPVQVVPPSERQMQIVSFWGPKPHEGGSYVLGLEVGGRKTIVALGRSQLDVGAIGNLFVHPNGDIVVHFFPSRVGLEPRTVSALDTGGPDRSQ